MAMLNVLTDSMSGQALAGYTYKYGRTGDPSTAGFTESRKDRTLAIGGVMPQSTLFYSVGCLSYVL